MAKKDIPEDVLDTLKAFVGRFKLAIRMIEELSITAWPNMSPERRREFKKLYKKLKVN